MAMTSRLPSVCATVGSLAWWWIVKISRNSRVIASRDGLHNSKRSCLVEAPVDTSAKPRRPDAPTRVESLNDFGKRMGWQTGDAAAIARMTTLTPEELLAMGLTEDLAAAWRDFYWTIKR